MFALGIIVRVVSPGRDNTRNAHAIGVKERKAMSGRKIGVFGVLCGIVLSLYVGL